MASRLDSADSTCFKLVLIDRYCASEPKEQGMTNKNQGILIVGGYGHVGSRIARRLLALGIKDIWVSGRNGSRAAETASQLGCNARTIDISNSASWQDALQHIKMVIVCIDLPDKGFAEYVLGNGLDYLDISASDKVLSRIEGLDDLAKEAGSRAVLSVGLAPGLTNLMAMKAVKGMARTDKVTIGVLLGLGDEHGAAAVDWTLDNLSAVSLDMVRNFKFGHPARSLVTIPFDFADQHVFERRHGLKNVETRLALASLMITKWSLLLMSRLAASPLFRKVLRWSMSNIRLGSDRAALAVEAEGQVDGQAVHRRIILEGHAEAEITALVAARVAYLLLESAFASGVWHIQELWPLEAFINDLNAEGTSIQEFMSVDG